jgi:hypothetical protein
VATDLVALLVMPALVPGTAPVEGGWEACNEPIPPRPDYAVGAVADELVDGYNNLSLQVYKGRYAKGARFPPPPPDAAA